MDPLDEPTGISIEARRAAVSFLARYEGATYDDHRLSLDIYFRWCVKVGLDPLDAKRFDLELFMRQHLIVERKNKPSSVVHRMHTLSGFYRFAVIDDVVAKNPVDAVKLPKLHHDPYRDDFLSVEELRAFIDTAKASDRPSDKGLIALLALLGLRINEALGVQIEDFRDTIHGHRVLRLTGKGAVPVTVPLPPEAVELLDQAADGRVRGPLLVRDRSSVRALVGLPLTYSATQAALKRLVLEAGLDRKVTPHMFRRGYVTAGLDAGVSMRDMQIAARHKSPSTTSRYDRGALNLDRHANHLISNVITGRQGADQGSPPESDERANDLEWDAQLGH